MPGAQPRPDPLKVLVSRIIRQSKGSAPGSAGVR